MLTTELSRRAMPDPTTVATSVSHLRLCDRAASKVGVAAISPASHGGRVNPTIYCSRRTRIASQPAPGVYTWQLTCGPQNKGGRALLGPTYEGFNRAQYVFTGKVAEINGHTWTVDVDRVWKAADKLAKRLLDVYASIDWESCFELDRAYIFFAIVAKSSRYVYYQSEFCNWTRALHSIRVASPHGAIWLEDLILERSGKIRPWQGTNCGRSLGTSTEHNANGLILGQSFICREPRTPCSLTASLEIALLVSRSLKGGANLLGQPGDNRRILPFEAEGRHTGMDASRPFCSRCMKSLS
jgi:hypothetical protein